MTNDELISNLGTIARSGSKAFVEAMQQDKDNTTANKQDAIIGQFGVGFYSLFMVSDKVEVYSKPAILGNNQSESDTKGYYWTSDGSGEYRIAEATNVQRGTKIVLHLKDSCREFADPTRIENVIKKYSSFLEFGIKINGKLMSSTGAIWSKQPSNVKAEEYRDFYQMISDRNDEPYYTYHSHFDTSTFSAQCVLYVPQFSGEKFGGRQESGVSLYCKKVLVSKNCQDIVPEWLRFLRGVIDCEDIPIHISRENMQDSQLMEQVKDSVLTKIVDYLNKQSKKDSNKFNTWYKEFEQFIKEGVVSYHDQKRKEKICKLLRYDVSTTTTRGDGETDNNNDGGLISFDEYIESLPFDIKDTKKEIYYLHASNRESAMNSPYIESFIDSNIPVLLCYQSFDEYIMKQIQKYGNYTLVGIESANIDDHKKTAKENVDNSLTKEECETLSDWFSKEFPKEIEKVEITNRLKSHPCVLNDSTPQAIRQFMKQMGGNMNLPTPPQTMEINPNHDIIKHLYYMIKENDNNIKAKIVGKQLINNAFIAAGIVEDAKSVLPDINTLIEIALNVEKDFSSSGVASADVTDVTDASDASDMEADVHSVDAEATVVDATVDAEHVQDEEKESKAQ